jgi:hypothetical protein
MLAGIHNDLHLIVMHTPREIRTSHQEDVCKLIVHKSTTLQICCHLCSEEWLKSLQESAFLRVYRMDDACLHRLVR